MQGEAARGARSLLGRGTGAEDAGLHHALRGKPAVWGSLDCLKTSPQLLDFNTLFSFVAFGRRPTNELNHTHTHTETYTHFLEHKMGIKNAAGVKPFKVPLISQRKI